MNDAGQIEITNGHQLGQIDDVNENQSKSKSLLRLSAFFETDRVTPQLWQYFCLSHAGLDHSKRWTRITSWQRQSSGQLHLANAGTCDRSRRNCSTPTSPP
jgi:hypothetical protein